MTRRSSGVSEAKDSAGPAFMTASSESHWSEPDLAIDRLGEGPPAKLLKSNKKESQIPRYATPPSSTASSRSNGRDSSNQSSLQRGPDSSGTTNGSIPSRSISPSPVEKKLKIKLKTSVYESIVKDSEVRKSPRVTSSVDYYPTLPDINEQDTGARNGKKDTKITIKRSRSSTPKSTPSPRSADNSQKERKIKRIKITASPSKEPSYRQQGSLLHSSLENEVSKDDLPVGVKKEEEEQQQAVSQPEPNGAGLINNDFCSACGGTGRFLCCETCPRSFHFSCVDPPLDEDTLPEGEWHCRACHVKKHPPQLQRRGVWAQLMNRVERRNPQQYLLPKSIRERYEGVVTLPNGEFEQDPHPNAPASDRIVRDAEDPLKILDRNGNPILCYRCKQSALNEVQMLSCDYCPLSFHVDCVDPPVLQAGVRWKCPNHADQAVKLPRRPKKIKYEEPAVARGFKNNGHIEILDDESESDNFMGMPPVFATLRDTPQGIAAGQPQKLVRNFQIDDVVYKLPEHAITMDFLEMIHSEDREETFSETNNAKILMALDEVASKDFRERQAVRDLCSLHAQNTVDGHTAMSAANLRLLVDAAIADIDVGEREQLLALQQLIKLKGKEKLMEFLNT